MLKCLFVSFSLHTDTSLTRLHQSIYRRCPCLSSLGAVSRNGVVISSPASCFGRSLESCQLLSRKPRLFVTVFVVAPPRVPRRPFNSLTLMSSKCCPFTMCLGVGLEHRGLAGTLSTVLFRSSFLRLAHPAGVIRLRDHDQTRTDDRRRQPPVHSIRRRRPREATTAPSTPTNPSSSSLNILLVDRPPWKVSLNTPCRSTTITPHLPSERLKDFWDRSIIEECHELIHPSTK
jgi:hypothetical protein